MIGKEWDMGDLRHLYEQWVGVKQTVAAWFQTNGWLLELGAVGIVGFIFAVFVGLLLFAWVLTLFDQGGKPHDG
jgi:hypothetical protein